MNPYLISLSAGLAAGVVYGLLRLRSPAPPVVALVGLFGILLGEQATPLVLRLLEGRPPEIVWQTLDRANEALGRLAGAPVARG